MRLRAWVQTAAKGRSARPGKILWMLKFLAV